MTREDFEAKMQALYPTWDTYVLLHRTANGKYASLITQACWLIWQEATQAAPGELCPACAASEFERVSGFGELK
jgi:hypothetical protein